MHSLVQGILELCGVPGALTTAAPPGERLLSQPAMQGAAGTLTVQLPQGPLGPLWMHSRRFVTQRLLTVVALAKR